MRQILLSASPELYREWTTCPDTTGIHNWTAEDYRRWNAAYPKMQALVRMMRDAGVLLTTGTDLTIPWIIPGEGLHQEFQLLVAAGLSPAEVLSMTGENAALALERCGRDRSWPSGRPRAWAQIHWRTSTIPGASAGSCRQASACLTDQDEPVTSGVRLTRAQALLAVFTIATLSSCAV
jgi:hypothetical protein